MTKTCAILTGDTVKSEFFALNKTERKRQNVLSTCRFLLAGIKMIFSFLVCPGELAVEISLGCRR